MSESEGTIQYQSSTSEEEKEDINQNNEERNVGSDEMSRCHSELNRILGSESSISDPNLKNYREMFLDESIHSCKELLENPQNVITHTVASSILLKFVSSLWNKVYKYKRIGEELKVGQLDENNSSISFNEALRRSGLRKSSEFSQEDIIERNHHSSYKTALCRSSLKIRDSVIKGLDIEEENEELYHRNSSVLASSVKSYLNSKFQQSNMITNVLIDSIYRADPNKNKEDMNKSIRSILENISFNNIGFRFNMEQCVPRELILSKSETK